MQADRLGQGVGGAVRVMGPLSGQFSLQIGPDQGEASQLATAIARAGAEQGLSCPAVVATTQVLERRLAVTSPPGDLILLKARRHPVRRRFSRLLPGCGGSQRVLGLELRGEQWLHGGLRGGRR